MDKDIVAYIQSVKSIPDISKAEEVALVGRIQRDDQRAAYRLAEAHAKRVVALAEQFQKYNPQQHRHDLAAIIQAGNNGLLVAVHTYQLGTTEGFWDYARGHVRREIEKLIQYS